MKNKKYLICAPTGIAAVQIEGRTLHSALKLPFDDAYATLDEFKNWVFEQLSIAEAKAGAKRTGRPVVSKFSQTFLKMIRSLEVLIIDEISMLSTKTFQQMNVLLQLIRRSSYPMGQVRCVFVGDFFQLPPVQKAGSKFVFEDKLFQNCIQRMIRLQVSFRQQDSIFVNLLNRCRIGQLNPEDVELLKQCLNKDVSRLGIEPTVLQSRNADVDRLNREKIEILFRRQAKRSFLQRKTTSWQQKRLHISSEASKMMDDQLDRFVKESRSDTVVELCEETQVILSYNLDVDRGLCNGARGVIVGFKEPETPDPASIFEKQTLEEPMAQPKESLPIVRFQNGLQVLVPQVRLSREQRIDEKNPRDKGPLLCLWQVPLKLAWATTVHKSQGLTLDCVKFQMDRSVFETGQAYVALSRVKTIEGLSLSSFDSSVIVSNEKVVFFEQHSQEFLKDFYTDSM